MESWGSIRNIDFSVWKDSIFIDSLFTDSLGRFETEIEADTYLLKDTVTDTAMVNPFEAEFQLMEGHSEYFFSYYMMCAKPNIYLYPETKITLYVDISFPHTGEVIVSDPQYPEQWENLQIEPNGKINSKYDYLILREYTT